MGQLVGPEPDAGASRCVDLIAETMEARGLPGAGSIPLVDVIRTLDAIGSSAPIGVEVFSTELQRLPAEEAARRCAEAGRRVLAAARQQ